MMDRGAVKELVEAANKALRFMARSPAQTRLRTAAVKVQACLDGPVSVAEFGSIPQTYEEPDGER
jgi:hypothetical protein